MGVAYTQGRAQPSLALMEDATPGAVRGAAWDAACALRSKCISYHRRPIALLQSGVETNEADGGFRGPRLACTGLPTIWSFPAAELLQMSTLKVDPSLPPCPGFCKALNPDVKCEAKQTCVSRMPCTHVNKGRVRLFEFTLSFRMLLSRTQGLIGRFKATSM